MHPPILYVGYVGLSVAFSFAIAALINGEINKQWATFLRPWIITSWIALTLGIIIVPTGTPQALTGTPLAQTETLALTGTRALIG